MPFGRWHLCSDRSGWIALTVARYLHAFSGLAALWPGCWVGTTPHLEVSVVLKPILKLAGASRSGWHLHTLATSAQILPAYFVLPKHAWALGMGHRSEECRPLAGGAGFSGGHALAAHRSGCLCLQQCRRAAGAEGVKVGAENHVRIFRRSKVGKGEVMIGHVDVKQWYIVISNTFKLVFPNLQHCYPLVN